MEKINAVVTMKNIYSYEAPAYGYGYETRYIYTMESEDGTCYVWKTTAYMAEKFLDENGWDIDSTGRKWNYSPINKGDVIRITASIKGQSEYKGQPQTELTRVKLVERTFKAKTWEEIQAEREAEKQAKKEEQLASIQGGDMLWEMPYKQYKEHYSDCETLEGSFKRTEAGVATIGVIIREGRLKASGVRGKHYSGYEFYFNENGKRVRCTFRAVSEENALKQLHKEFKDATEIKAGKIYRYEY